MSPSKLIIFVWSNMAARIRHWGVSRHPSQLTIREFKVLSNGREGSQSVESARKILTLMFLSLKKRGRPTKKYEEDRDAA